MADVSEHARPGEPPPVRDEAADTPMWLPIVGLCLLLFGAMALLWQSANEDEEPATIEAEPAAEGEAPAEEGAAEEAPAEAQPAAEPAAEPAADPHAGHGH